MGQAILHFRKIKTSSDLANVAAHNTRENYLDETGGWIGGKPPEWMKHPELYGLNAGQIGTQEVQMAEAWQEAIEKANIGRKPQKNAARAIEAVFQASEGVFKNNDEQKIFLDDCRAWAEEKFGAENVLRWSTHFDETSPHLHMIFIPIIRGEKNKYSSADFLGGPAGLANAQEEFFQYLKNKNYQFDGREIGSQKKHTDQREWKSELIKKNNEIEKKENSVNEKIKNFELYKNEITEKINNKKNDIEAEKIILQELENNLNLTAVENIGKKIVTILQKEKSTPPEREKFWPLFWERLPAFVKSLFAEVKQNINLEKSPNARKKRISNFKI